MTMRISCLNAAVGASLVVMSPLSALAQNKIGVAATITNDVAQILGPRAEQIAGGEGLVRDEVVRTGAASNAKLVFVDDTNLAMGPTSTVKLDKFVFADATSYNQAGMELTRGAFRFTTGHSEKRAYDLKTPVATIGIRGTILDVLSQGSKTTIVLQEGEAKVCPRRARNDTKRRDCVDLVNIGDTAVVTPNGAALTPPGWTFASNCQGSLCNVTLASSVAGAPGPVLNPVGVTGLQTPVLGIIGLGAVGLIVGGTIGNHDSSPAISQ